MDVCYKLTVLGGGIPDAAAIHAARKKRELLRAKGGQEEFIPLKPKAAAKAPEELKKMGKRLVREEDEEEVSSLANILPIIT
jgi:hypothetical protein